MRELGKIFQVAIYILIDMKKTNYDALGELIDTLIEVTISPTTPNDVSDQLEPIIEGLVSISQNKDIKDPIFDFKKIIDLYLMDEMMRAMRTGQIGEA